MRQRGLIFIVAIMALLAFKAWHAVYTVRQFTKHGEFFGSYVKVDVCYQRKQRESLKSALDTVWARFADIHSRLSIYDPKSDINKINQSYTTPVTVPEDTYKRIKDSIEYNKISKGVFDITIGPLIILWKEKGKAGLVPTDAEIKGAISKVDMKAVSLMDNRQIMLTRPDVKINIDSIGDGYAADEAAKILRANGFHDFLVDASGELYAAGHNCQGNKWRIGIRDPHDTEKIIDVVELSDQAVSTSGSYERFYEIEGKRWSHIIDPRSGYPAEGIISATVLAPSAEFADFLSTAFCILTSEESVGIVDNMGKDYAVMMVVKGALNERKVLSRRYLDFSSEK